MKNRTAAIAALAASLVLVPSAAHADRAPVNEGGDTQPCVTYTEFNLAFLGTNREHVKRLFDTDGHRVSSGLMDGMADQVQTMPGTEVAVPEHRMVRFYLGCVTDTDPYGADVYVEYNMRTGRMVASLWI
jgi:hypothetical protein